MFTTQWITENICRPEALNNQKNDCSWTHHISLFPLLLFTLTGWLDPGNEHPVPAVCLNVNVWKYIVSDVCVCVCVTVRCPWNFLSGWCTLNLNQVRTCSPPFLLCWPIRSQDEFLDKKLFGQISVPVWWLCSFSFCRIFISISNNYIHLWFDFVWNTTNSSRLCHRILMQQVAERLQGSTCDWLPWCLAPCCFVLSVDSDQWLQRVCFPLSLSSIKRPSPLFIQWTCMRMCWCAFVFASTTRNDKGVVQPLDSSSRSVFCCMEPWLWRSTLCHSCQTETPQKKKRKGGEFCFYTSTDEMWSCSTALHLWVSFIHMGRCWCPLEEPYMFTPQIVCVKTNQQS